MPQHRFDISIYSEDTDYGGIVYHANYLKYMERARTEWLNSLGISLQTLSEQNVLLVVRKATLHFFKPAVLNDVIVIESDVTLIKNTRLFFKQNVVKKDAPSIIYCRGEIELVCISRDNKKPVRIPPLIIERIVDDKN